MEEKSALISIVIPTFKRGNLYLKRAIQSALDQTYADIEIIVVDDNDPGTSFRRETETIMEEFEIDSRIRYIRHDQNKGGSVARNTGIHEAKGGWIAFLDDDDEWAPTKLEEQMRAAEQSNDSKLAFVYCIAKRVDGNGNVKGFRGRRVMGNMLKHHLIQGIANTSAVLVKGDVLNEINGFRPLACGQEHDLILRILALGYTAGFVEEPLVVLHEHHDPRITTGPGKIEGMKRNRLEMERYLHRLNPKEAKEVKHRIALDTSGIHVMEKDYAAAFKALYRAFALRPLYSGNIRRLLSISIKRSLMLLKSLLLSLLSDKAYINHVYRRKKKKAPNFKDPISLNDKIQWLKLYNRNPLLPTLADKYAVREYVRTKIGEEALINLIGVYQSVDEIDFSKLPDQFILKATHGSGWVIICRSKADLNIAEVKRKLAKWLKTNYYWFGREWAYKHIKPRIVCETLLQDEKGNCPEDYKIYCFHGEPALLHITYDRFLDPKTDFYDMNWTKIPLATCYPNSSLEPARPDNFDDLKDIARKLSADLPFARIDLYNVDNKVYFGEITLYPVNGFMEFDPPSYDLELGQRLNLKKP